MPARDSRRRKPRVDDAIVLTVLDLANHLLRRGEALARSEGLTTQQWLVLLQIAGDPSFPGPTAPTDGLAPSEIASARGVSRANVSAIVSQLTARGLVRQVRDAADGRSRRLHVTAAGQRAIDAIEPARRQANRKLLAHLDGSERKALLALLEPCLAALRDG